MKNKNKILVLISLLLIPTMVYASSGNESMPIFWVIFIEAFVTPHVSLFLLKPLSEIISKEDSKKTFWTLFTIRVFVLLFFDFFISTTILIVDVFVLFVGAFVLVPILAAITGTKLNKKSNQVIKTSTLSSSTPVDNNQVQVTPTEYRCAKCNNIVKPWNKYCVNCGTPLLSDNDIISSNPNETQPIMTKQVVHHNDFDLIYSLSEDNLLETFINKELTKIGYNAKSKMLPAELIKRKKVLNIIFTVLVAVFIFMIFVHFPIYTYIMGIILLLVFFIATRKFDIMKFLKKQIKARPGERITSVIMSTNIVQDDSKRIILIGLLIAIIIPLIVCINPIIIYEKTDSGYAVRYYLFGLTNFKTATIPETHNNKKVVSLRGNTFSNMPFLESVVLPDTITEIRGQAFKNCINLKEINIPKELEYLGGGAFYNAKSITRIDLPDTLTYLGGEAFYNASSLETVKLSENLTEIRGDSFAYCESLRSIKIPDKVTRIGGHAFYWNTNLSQVSISENSQLAEIGSSAFRKCSYLYNITIPPYTVVNDRAFKESPTTIKRYGYENSVTPKNTEVTTTKNTEITTTTSQKTAPDNTSIIRKGVKVTFTKYNIEINYENYNNNIATISVKKNGTTKTVNYDFNRRYQIYIGLDNYVIELASSSNSDLFITIMEMVPSREGYKYFVNYSYSSDYSPYQAEIVSDKVGTVIFTVTNPTINSNKDYKIEVELSGSINKKLTLTPSNHSFDSNNYVIDLRNVSSRSYKSFYAVLYFN